MLLKGPLPYYPGGTLNWIRAPQCEWEATLQVYGGPCHDTLTGKKKAGCDFTCVYITPLK